jgi:DNA-binding HxlR family transcriptional regulator
MNRGDLADLTAFVAVADHLRFRAAASRLGVTPSALSHSMRDLEERLLLNRTTCSPGEAYPPPRAYCSAAEGRAANPLLRARGQPM